MFGQNSSPFGGGGAFGQSNTAPGFGSPAPAPQGGLFGAPAPAPFGAPAPAFGSSFQTPATSTPFGSTAPAPGGNIFGQPPAPSGFGGGGGGVFGGQAPAPSGGLFAPAPSGFAAPAPSGGGGLFGGTTTNNTSNSMFGGGGTTGFGQPSTFGAPAPAFGAPAPANSGSLFGAPAPAPSGGLFGAPAPAPFGASAPAPFGGSNFGSPAPAPFGASAPAPGGGLFSSAAPNSGGMFGPGAAQGAPGAGGTRQTPFTPTGKQDGSSSITLQSISAMPAYEQKSFEELRMEDYAQGNRGSANSTPTAGNTTSFFGGAPTPAPGGLFNSTAAPAQSGGLFGSSPAPAPFGAAPSSGGLFSAAPSSAAPSFGGGGFGASPAPAPFGGGGFGASPAPAPFGAAAPSSGSLFGGTPAPAFGAAPASGSLFGSPAPAPFGSSAPAPFGAPAPGGGGGLFGAPAPSAFGGGGGLFGQAPAPSGSLFGQPSGGSSFGQPAPAPFGSFGAPAPAQSGFGAASQGSFGSFGQPVAAQPAPPMMGGSGIPANANIIPPAGNQMLQQNMRQLQQMSEELEKKRVWQPDNGGRSNTTPTGLSSQNASFFASPPPYAISSASMLASTSSPPSATKMRPRGFPKGNSSSTKKQMPKISDIGRGGVLSRQSQMRSPVMQLEVKPNSLSRPRLRLTNGPVETLTGPPNENSPLESDGRSHGSPTLTPFAARNTTTPPAHSATSPHENAANMKASTAAEALYRDAIVDTPEPGRDGEVTHSATGSHLAPKLTTAGYFTSPPIEELSKMSEAELAAVENFTVSRPGYGEVSWEGAVDVRGVDIDRVVSIESKDVAVYFREEDEGTKPAVGHKLNRPAMITYEEVFPRSDPTAPKVEMDKFAERLQKVTNKMGATFVDYERQTGTWKIRVQHF